MLSKSELKAAKLIYEGESDLGKLSSELNLGEFAIYKIVSKLEKKGLCIKQKTGKKNKSMVTKSDTTVANALHDYFIQKPGLPLEKFCYGLPMKILLACLYEEKTTLYLSKLFKTSRKTVQNTVSSLKNRGILRKTKEGLIFNEKSWSIIQPFLESYRNHFKKGYVLWKFNSEVIFESQIQEDAIPTGLSAYKHFGVPMSDIKICYYLPKRKLNKEDVFIHSLMQLGDDPRLTMLAMIFWVKNKLSRNKLLDRAIKYDQVKKMDHILNIISKKETPYPEREIKEMFALYRVKR